MAKMLLSWRRALRVTVSWGGISGCLIGRRRAETRSLAAAMTKSVWVAVGRGVLCGSQVMVSVMRSELVAGIQTR